MPTLDHTEHQKAIAKALNKKLRTNIKKGGGGATLMGAKGCGKTRIIGVVNSKPHKDVRMITLYGACKTDHADKQADEIGVAAGVKPLTQGRLPTVKNAFKTSSSATFTLTPASTNNLLNPKHSFRKEFVKTIAGSGVKFFHLIFDEAHKAYNQTSCNKPARVESLRDELKAHGIALVITGVTATPLWNVKSKAQEGQAKRACRLFGIEVSEDQTTVEALEESMVSISPEDTKSIFAVTKPLQTTAPEEFERHELLLPGKAPTKELLACMSDAAPLLVGLALDGSQGHIDRLVGFKTCASKAVVQKALDDYAIEEVLSNDGMECHSVIEGDDGSLSLGETITVRANAIIVVDTPVARKYLIEQLQDRATNEENARPMKLFDFTTKDRATFQRNMTGFVHATKHMTSGHPIGIIEPSQMEGSNEFGKNVSTIIAIGDFASHLLNQGAGRLARPVPMEAGDLVPVDGYKAVHLASKWQSALVGALKSKVSHTKPLPAAAAKALDEYEAESRCQFESLFGEEDNDEEDPVFERVATATKQFAKLDAAKRLPAPYNNLAMTYLEAKLDSDKREAQLTRAFGESCEDNAQRKHMGSVLARYMLGTQSAIDVEADAEDAVMLAGGDGEDMSDSDEDE